MIVISCHLKDPNDELSDHNIISYAFCYSYCSLKKSTPKAKNDLVKPEWMNEWMNNFESPTWLTQKVSGSW